MENIEEWKFKIEDINKIISDKQSEMEYLQSEITEYQNIMKEIEQENDESIKSNIKYSEYGNKIEMLTKALKNLKDDIGIINLNVQKIREHSAIAIEINKKDEITDEDKIAKNKAISNIKSLRECLALQYKTEIRSAMKERLEKETKEREDFANEDNDVKQEIEVNSDDVEKISELINQIKETYDKFIDYNTELFESNKGKVERVVTDFSLSLEDRIDEINSQIKSLDEAIVNHPENSELVESKKILEEQTVDINTDQKSIETWNEKNQLVNKNIQEAMDMQKENREIIDNIKKLTEELIDVTDEKEKQSKLEEIEQLSNKRKDNRERLQKLSKENKEIFEELDTIASNFKTVGKDAKFKTEVQKQKEAAQVTSQNEQDISQSEVSQAAEQTENKEESHDALPPVENENLKNLPSLSYQTIIDTYIDEPSGRKSDSFLRNNFFCVMGALDEALQKGKLKSSQKRDLKDALVYHKHEIDHNMKMFNSSALYNIYSNLFKDDEEKLNEYTTIDEDTGERKLNTNIFASIYKKEKIGDDEYRCELNDLSKMDDEAHNFISIMFIKYDHMLKEGKINENSELYKQFNKYVSDPVKYQMLEKAGTRVCKQNIFQKIKDKFSRKNDEDKAEYLKDFLVKVDKSRAEIQKDNDDKLGLKDQVNQDPPTINPEEQAQNKDEKEKEM